MAGALAADACGLQDLVESAYPSITMMLLLPVEGDSCELGEDCENAANSCSEIGLSNVLPKGNVFHCSAVVPLSALAARFRTVLIPYSAMHKRMW